VFCANALRGFSRKASFRAWFAPSVSPFFRLAMGHSLGGGRGQLSLARPASLEANRDVETSAIVDHSPVVDAQEKRTSHRYVKGFALADKEKP